MQGAHRGVFFPLSPEYLAAHPGVDRALRRTRLLLAALLIPIPVIFFWRWWSGPAFPWPLLILGAIPAGFGWALRNALATGYASTNHGEFTRDRHPAGYWVSISLLLLGYLFALAGVIFIGRNTP